VAGQRLLEATPVADVPVEAPDEVDVASAPVEPVEFLDPDTRLLAALVKLPTLFLR
jgi:hypothetical protein